MDNIELYTIGFTKKGAKTFFELLKNSNAARIIDVRLNNGSQLAGFAKRADLEFFAKELCEMDYLHVPDFAPTKDILDAYKKHGGDWVVYEEKFMELMDKRNAEKSITPELVDGGCLLCSEHEPHHCHRRLVAEYLNDKWNLDLSVTHLF